MNKKLLLSLFLCFFVFSLSVVSQEFEVFKQEKEWKVKMRAEEEGSGVIIYVDDAIGDDDKGKGTEKKPYKTIGRALEVAGSGDTINVGPGVYYESLEIRTPEQIILKGSGSGSTTINGSIYVGWCDLLRIERFTITSLEEDVIGISCDRVDNASVKDCIIDMPNGSGLRASLNTSIWIYDSQLINSSNRNGALARSSSYMWLENCTVSGNSTGVLAQRGAVIYFIDSEIRNNNVGIDVCSNSNVMLSGTSIHNNMFFGIWIAGCGFIRPGGPDLTKIFENGIGIYTQDGGNVLLWRQEIYNNEYGIMATEASVLLTYGGKVNIHHNDYGVVVKEFAHAFLKVGSIRDNKFFDVTVHTGGQAICNLDIIGTIDSDCEYCPPKS
jgi:hypothetical protein